MGIEAAQRLRRNVSLDVLSAVGLGIGMSLVGVLLPTIARRAGLDPIGLAVLAAAPFLANLLGVFAGWFGPRSPRQLARLRAVGMLALVPVALVTHPLAMLLAALGFWLSFSFAVPFQMRMQGVIYPRARWGRLIGIVATARAAAMGIGALVAGVLADGVGGTVTIALGALVGAVVVSAVGWIRAPELGTTPGYTVRGSIRALTSRRPLRRLALAQGLWGAGVIGATPLYALVQVDRLHLSLAEVGLLGTIGAGATTFSYLAWGVLSDRVGTSLSLRVGSVLGVAALTTYAFAPSAPWLWLAGALGGMAGAGIELGIQRGIADHTPIEARAPAMAGWNAVTGLRGIAAPLAVGGVVGVGLLDTTSALVGCAIVAAVGALLYLRLPMAVAERHPSGSLAPAPARG